MTQDEFIVFCFKIWQRANKSMPRDTGNLADNSFKMEMAGDNSQCEFYIDLDIAPYAEYLEDGTGTGSAKHKDFFERCIKEAVKTTTIEYSARLEET